MRQHTSASLASRAIVVALGLGLATGGTASAADRSDRDHPVRDRAQQCVAAPEFHYGGNVGGVFSVRSTPLAGQRPTRGGLAETFTGNGDLDVVDYDAMTIGQLAERGIAFSGTGLTLNVWINSNGGRYFDLDRSGNGTFHSLNGDDYAGYTPAADPRDATIFVFGGTALPGGQTLRVADLAAGKYPGVTATTMIAVDAVLEGDGGTVTGTLTSLDHHRAATCDGDRDEHDG